MSACERVFNTFELAESIFLELSISTLLSTVQRTCRTWKTIVETSLRLQQTLFLKPVNNLMIHSRNRLPTHLCGPEVIVEHPLLSAIGSNGTSLARLFHANTDAALRPEASWRKCLMTQPPVAEICTFKDQRASSYDKIVNPEGVRLGELLRDEKDLRLLHASHVYDWVKWQKSTFYQGYWQLVRAVGE